jgi:hypothetical protein
MSLKEKFHPKSKELFFDELIDEIEKYGLGSMLKSDQDALLYHLIAKHITPGSTRNRHDWIRILRVKPGRLNGLQETASVKYDKIEANTDNWLKICRQLSNHSPEVQDHSAGKVVIYIDDAHLYRFLEKYLNDNGSSPEYQLNKTQLVLKYQLYLTILEQIALETGIDLDELKKKLKEDKSKGLITKAYASIGDLFKDLKSRVKEQTIKEGTKELLEYLGTTVVAYVQNKTK